MTYDESYRPGMTCSVTKGRFGGFDARVLSVSEERVTVELLAFRGRSEVELRADEISAAGVVWPS